MLFEFGCHPSISFSVVPFSSGHRSSPASGSFPMSQLFTSSGQSIGSLASASVPPMNFQDWFPLGWTGWMSLQSQELSRVFSSTTVWKHQFFTLSLFMVQISHQHMTTGKTIALNIQTFVGLYILICCLDWSYFSWQSWFQLVSNMTWHFSWCTLHIS